MQLKEIITALAILAAISTTAAFAGAAKFAPFPAWPSVVLIGLALGHLGTIAIWLARGRAHCVVRVVVAMGVAMVLARWLAAASLPTATQWLGLLGVYLVLVATPPFLARWVGAMLADSRPRHLRQFTLAGLMLLMTNVAVLVALSRFASPPTVQPAAAIFCAIGFATIALAVAQLTHLVASRLAFIAGSILVAGLVGGMLTLACGESSLFGQFVAITAIQSIVVAAAMLGTNTNLESSPSDRPEEIHAPRVFEGT
jgi:hypothetical protein